MEEYKSKILIYDWETIKSFGLLCVYNPTEDKFYDFEMNAYKNDLYSLINFLSKHRDFYWVGFNNIGFDSIITEYIWRNYESWYELSGLEIAEKIWEKSQITIDDSYFGRPLPYKEYELSFKQIDVPRILHWFNENRRVSLKQAEFELRAETIENFDVPHDKSEFSQKEREDLIYYCHNDVKYTYEVYKIVIGDTELQLYKGKDKIKDRFIIKEEVGLDCLNWDDVKIGAEWNKKDYLELSGKKEKDLKPQKIEHFYGKKFKLFFPPTAKFQTKELQSFINNLGEAYIKAEKQEFKYTFNDDLTICIAKGGIHSQEKNRYISSSESEIYIQNDIGSQYPNALRKFKIYPKHLGIQWNEMLVSKIQRRLSYKSLYKKTKEAKYNSLQEMGKMSLNGGSYGRLNTKGDWQEDPCAMLKVTIGCQLEILMIVEALILKGFKIVSCNTDGWDSIIEKDRLDEYFNIVSYYEELIGNKELGNVEYTVFDWIAQTSVNDYLAKKSGEYVNREFIPHKSKEKDDDLKAKGDFEYWKELHKNTSFSIFPLTYQKYFNEGIGPEEFINNHDNIFDFCARSNSGSTYYHEGYKDNKSFKLSKLLRYFVAKDGIFLKKIVKEDVDSGANDTNVQPADKKKVVCNRISKDDYKTLLSNVDREWYINKAKETIFTIEKGRKPKKNTINNPNQTSLF